MSSSGGELDVISRSPGPTEPLGEAKAIVGRSLWQIAWRRLRKDKVAMAGGVIAILLVLVALFAGQLSALYGHDWKSQDPNLLDPTTTMPMGPFGGASGDHWLGITPVLGQDVFAGLLYGARTSLTIASLATLLSLVLGVSLGLDRGLLPRLARLGDRPDDGHAAGVPDAAVLDRAAERVLDRAVVRRAVRCPAALRA